MRVIGFNKGCRKDMSGWKCGESNYFCSQCRAKFESYLKKKGLSETQFIDLVAEGKIDVF